MEDRLRLNLGQRVINDQLGEHKAEQRVVDSVKQMKTEGLSLRPSLAVWIL
jgi:hypothetical protein